MPILDGSSYASFVISLSQAAIEPVSIGWRTESVTAVPGVDYAETSGTVNFLPTETEKTVQVLVYGRAPGDTEPREFRLHLLPSPNIVLGSATRNCIITVRDEGDVVVSTVTVATGQTGLNAYEFAKLQGYAGTPAEWLASLKVQGDKGDTGDDGLTASQQFFAAGITTDPTVETMFAKLADTGTQAGLAAAAPLAEQAEEAAVRSEAARDVSLANGVIHDDTDEGLLASDVGDKFKALMPGGASVGLYRNNGATAALLFPFLSIANINAERDRALGAEGDLDNAIAGVATGLADAIGQVAEGVDAVAATAESNRLTAGEQTLIYARGQMFGGAMPILGPAGGINYVGFVSPAGLDTQLSFVTTRIAFNDADRARLTNRTIRLKVAATVSEGFLTDRKLSPVPVTVDLVGGGQRTAQGTLVRSEQIGTKLYREATYVVQGDEFFVGLPIQLANDSGTANDHSLQVVSATYAYEALPSQLATTPADEQLTANLDAYMAASGIDALPAALNEKRIAFVSSLAELTPLPAFFNDAVPRLGADGRSWGWTVPIDKTGTTTLMQVSLNLRGLGALLAGRAVEVSFAMDTSFEYSEFQEGGATFAVARPSNANQFLGTTITQPPTVKVDNPNRRIFKFSAVMDGTETVLKPFFRRGTQPPATSEQYILVTEVTLEIVASPSDALTLMEENLRLGEALRRAAADEAVTGQISAAILGTEAEVITVGPSGAHFTTLSEAIDAVTDSSRAKQYKLCWRAGTILGAPNRVVPAWTSIICADRNEDAILSYTLPTDADALTIRNTQLLWLYHHMSIIEGGTWLIENGRYVFHPESSGIHPDTEQRLIGLVAKHLGNLTAINNNWNIGSQFPIGCGMSDGQILKVIECDASGPAGGFSTHGPNNNQPWWRPWVCDLDSSRFKATWPGQFDVRVVSLAAGSGRVPLRNCSLETMQLTDEAWIGGPPAGDVNTAQVDIIAASCSPFEFTNSIALGSLAGRDYRPRIIGAGA